MTAEIDGELLSEMLRVEGTMPEHDIPVIITLNDWERRFELKERGFQMAHEFESISTVSGTLKPGEVREVARLDLVKNIEFDGEVRAISG